MPIDLLSRVRVTDLTSQHRGRLGVVKGHQDNLLTVRLDGHPDRKTVLMQIRQLQMSTQPIPVDYPDDVAPVTAATEAELAAAPSAFDEPEEPKKAKKSKG